MNPLEKDIEAKICKYAEQKYGMLQRKFTSPAHRSVPDRIFFTKKGTAFLIEFKQAGKKSTVLQEHEQKKYVAQNVKVFVVDNIPYGMMVVDLMGLN